MCGFDKGLMVIVKVASFEFFALLCFTLSEVIRKHWISNVNFYVYKLVHRKHYVHRFIYKPEI